MLVLDVCKTMHAYIKFKCTCYADIYFELACNFDSSEFCGLKICLK